MLETSQNQIIQIAEKGILITLLVLELSKRKLGMEDYPRNNKSISIL